MTADTGTSDHRDRPRIAASTPVRVIGAQAAVTEALRVMQQARVRHLPVVRDGVCLGLLVDRDVVAAMLEGVDPDAGRLCRHPVPRVGTDATPQEIAQAILSGGLDAALVVEADELVGIVTVTDAVLALAEGP